MPSIINSDDGVVSGTSGLKTTGGNDGILSIQNNGTTNVTVTAAGYVGVGTSSPIRSLTASGEFALAISGSTAYLNVSDTSGSNGSTKSLVIRGLASAGAAEATISGLTLNSSNLYFTGTGGASQMYPCRAWVNFNGTGTVAIRASGNVSSITDNGTGDYTVNFTNAMPDANYSSVFTSKWTTGQPSNFCGADSNGITSSSCRAIAIGNVSDSPLDSPFVNVAIFR